MQLEILREHLRSFVQLIRQTVRQSQIQREGFVVRSVAQALNRGVEVSQRHQRLGQPVECLGGKMIDAQRSLPFDHRFLMTLQLIENGSDEQVRLKNFRQQKDGLAQRFERFLRMPGRIQSDSDKVVKLGRSWFEFETVLKRFEGT